MYQSWCSFLATKLYYSALLGVLGALLARRSRRPRKGPSPLPVTRKVEEPEIEPKTTFIQRFATRRPTRVATTPIAVPVDVERQEVPPAFPEERRPSRRHSFPMESIPEQDAITGLPRRLSTHPNELISVEKPSPPIIQRNVEPLNRQPTQHTLESPSRQSTQPIVEGTSKTGPVFVQQSVEPLDPQSTQHIVKEPTDNPSRQPTTVVHEPPIAVGGDPDPTLSRQPTKPIEEPVRPVQRSASLPPEERTPDRINTPPVETEHIPTRATTLPDEGRPQSDTSKPILKRIRETWRKEPKVETRPPTPPPRIATVPPSRVPTAKVPEPALSQKAPTVKIPEPTSPKGDLTTHAPSTTRTPLIVVKDDGSKVPDVKINL